MKGMVHTAACAKQHWPGRALNCYMHSTRTSLGIYQLSWSPFHQQTKLITPSALCLVGKSGSGHAFPVMLDCATIGPLPGSLQWSPHHMWLLWSRAEAGPDTFADLPARKTFMVKCEAGKRELRTNSRAVFLQPLFYFVQQGPESTFPCQGKYDRVCIACMHLGVCVCLCVTHTSFRIYSRHMHTNILSLPLCYLKQIPKN